MKDLKDVCKIALVQAAPVMFDKKLGVEKTVKLIEEAAEKNVDLIVFPELFIPGYPYGMTYGFTVGSRNEKGREDWKVYYDNSIVIPGEETDILGKAAKAAHAHHFIQTLPGGYNMELNEDASNVSQGQKQLLTIARAILADNRILILDEATSSVDTRTEIRIQKALDNLMRGRTSFVIAHRLSTIKNADMILVMKDGDIIEQGNHEELIKKNGFYAELYNSQFEET